ncbi:hypothetical protein GKR56_11485 [Providencia alcalifaciens]|uniref:hypothetical protein n=1 Tax=Providencia alcalifaciens TaxID=126385 RepID=UPI0012B54A58|nr:hypothetical protein [Providencia alcalifaciens]MTC53854.1 hypothetical protein [Providencia alcalifaciens]
MDNALLFLKDNAVAVGIVLTIVGLIGGAIGASVRFLIDSKKIENEKKALRQQMITNNIAPMRQAWINDVRNKTSEFLSLCYVVALAFDPDIQDGRSSNQIEGNKDRFNYVTKLLSIYNNLLLLLPQNEDESIKIKYLLEEAMNKTLADVTSKNIDELHDLITVVSNKVQQLLKKEWEVTKSLKEIE